jgi:hypothetical protein
MSLTPFNQTLEDFQFDSTQGRIRANNIMLGFVRDNVDVQKMGRLRVFIPELGGEEDNEENWYIVSYASPFAGATSITQNKEGGKTMAESQKSYGWWAVPPDLDNEVFVFFVGGDTARGYWFACAYQQFMNHMVPGIPLNYVTDPQGDDGLIPCVEYNKKDDSQDIWDPDRPTYKPLYEAVKKQGLLQDPERGFSTSGARRDPDGKPPGVFGLLSPKGSTIHIDDNPENAFIRLRTTNGVQVLVHDTTGYIYINSKEGNSWMEISDDGISIYSKKSINFRSEENINRHADGSMLTNSGASHGNTGNDTNAANNKRDDTKKYDRNGNLINDNGENPQTGDGNNPNAKDAKDAKSLIGQSGGSKGVDDYLKAHGVKGGSSDGKWCGRAAQAIGDEKGVDPNSLPSNPALARNWATKGERVDPASLKGRDLSDGYYVMVNKDGSHVQSIDSVNPNGSVKTLEGNWGNKMGSKNIPPQNLGNYEIRKYPLKS